MNKIILKKINIKNFGGIASFEKEFTEKQNIMFAVSGTCKTSTFKAYKWGLGFDSDGIFPSIQNKIIKNLVTSVELQIEKDGLIYTLVRESKQIWKQDKITGDLVFAKRDYQYLFDGVSCDKKIYLQKINELFGVTNMFELEIICDITAFNRDKLPKWNETARREYLFSLFGINEKVTQLADKPEYNLIAEELKKQTPTAMIKKALLKEKNGIEKEQNDIDVLIKDSTEELVKLSSIDFDTIEKEKNKVLEEINNFSLTDSDNLTERQTLLNEIEALQKEKQEIEKKNLTQELSHTKTLSSKRIEGIEKANELSKLNNKKTEIEKIITETEKKLEKENQSVLDKSNMYCPVCGKEFDSKKIDTIIADFAKNKSTKIKNLAIIIEKAKKELEETHSLINSTSEELNRLRSEYKTLNNDCLKISTEEIENQIAEKQQRLDGLMPQLQTNNKLKTELQNRYEELVKALSDKDNIVKIKNKIQSLKDKQKELAMQDSLRIQKANQLKEYIQEKIKMAGEINNCFGTVKWLFFRYNSANAENEYEEICVPSLNDVPYASCSSGERIIIDTVINDKLQELLNVNVPQFIDDAVLCGNIGNECYSDSITQKIYLVTYLDNMGKDVACETPMRISEIYNIEDCI